MGVMMKYNQLLRMLQPLTNEIPTRRLAAICGLEGNTDIDTRAFSPLLVIPPLPAFVQIWIYQVIPFGCYVPLPKAAHELGLI